MNRAKSLTLGLVTGGIAAGIGVLLSSPYSGRELRSRLTEKKEKTKETVLNFKQQTTNVKDQVQTVVKTGNIALKDITQDLSKSAKDWKQDTSQHQDAIHSYLNEIQESVTSLEQQVQHHKTQNPE